MEAIAFIIGLIGLTAAGGAGWYVWKKKKDFLAEEERLKNIEKDVADDLKEVESEWAKNIADVELAMRQRIAEIEDMNTVDFDCPCNHNIIRVKIDLSKQENTFICPICKNEYIVDINMVPILKGRIVEENTLYSLLTEKFNESRAKASSRDE